MQTEMTLDRAEAQRLADIALVGISRGRLDEARAIFSALGKLKPRQEIGPVGLAMVHLGAGDPGAAEAALKDAPQTPAVLAFSCVALAARGDRAAAADMAEELREIADDPALTAMADAALAV